MQTNKPGVIARQCAAHGAYVAIETIVAGAILHSQCPQCVESYRQALTEAEEKQKLDAVASRIAAADIPLRFSRKALSDFVADNAGQKKAHAVASKYVKQWGTVEQSGTSLIFCGGMGTGKTLLANIILQEVIARYGSSGLYATALNAVRRIKETWRSHRDHVSETEKQAIQAFVKPGLLVLDEIGVQFGTEAEKLLLFDILDGRYRDVKPTILISNDDVGAMERYLGARVISRLKEGGGYLAVFDWQDYREGGQ